MKAVLSPTWVLLQRYEFLTGIEEVAFLCNWSEREAQGLKDHLWEELVRIDNALYETFEITGDHKVAYRRWVEQMEDLRRWLSLIIGIKIRYI